MPLCAVYGRLPGHAHRNAARSYMRMWKLAEKSRRRGWIPGTRQDQTISDIATLTKQTKHTHKRRRSHKARINWNQHGERLGYPTWESRHREAGEMRWDEAKWGQATTECKNHCNSHTFNWYATVAAAAAACSACGNFCNYSVGSEGWGWQLLQMGVEIARVCGCGVAVRPVGHWAKWGMRLMRT